MQQMSVYLPAVLLLAGLMVAWTAAYRVGRWRATREREQTRADLGAVQAGVLGLLALLLGFTYSYTVSRHEDRRQAVVREANAIGTCYLRTELVRQPQRDDLRTILRQYASLRIVEGEEYLRDPARLQAVLAQSDDLQRRLWNTAMQGIGRPPSPADTLVVASVNEVIDVHTIRLAAAREHLPTMVVWLLFLTAVSAMGISGFIAGLGEHLRPLFALVLAVLIVAVIFVILDLDRPQSGFIRVSQLPLTDLVQGMK